VCHIDQCLRQKHHNGARAVPLHKNIALGFLRQFTTADREAWHMALHAGGSERRGLALDLACRFCLDGFSCLMACEGPGAPVL
jgi:hypothetical protein